MRGMCSIEAPGDPGIPLPLPGQDRDNTTPSTGCAALHPWLQAAAPAGAEEPDFLHLCAGLYP